jgi:branched-chain amino acid transport system substrate-binding protein
MRTLFKYILILAVAAAASVGSASAQTPAISDDAIKIGVLTDMSGQFSHESGEGAVTAVRMAVEDFGGKVLGKPIEVLVADQEKQARYGVGTGA